MSSYFCSDLTVRADDYGVTTVYDDAKAAITANNDYLVSMGFQVRDQVYGTKHMEALRLLLEGDARLIRPKPSRVWTLFYAIEELLARGRCSGTMP